MAFVGKWIGGLAKDLGLVNEPSAPPTPPAAPTLTSASTQSTLDTSAQQAAAAMSGGSTSTAINGPAGVDDSKKSSKILLGR